MTQTIYKTKNFPQVVKQSISMWIISLTVLTWEILCVLPLDTCLIGLWTSGGTGQSPPIIPVGFSGWKRQGKQDNFYIGFIGTLNALCLKRIEGKTCFYMRKSSYWWFLQHMIHSYSHWRTYLWKSSSPNLSVYKKNKSLSSVSLTTNSYKNQSRHFNTD